jgi:serine/threonine protein kinase
MIVADRYEVGAPLGAGGEARVFCAHDRLSGVDVALRLTPATGIDTPATPPPALLHPGWVQIFDRGIDPEHGSYAAFELLSGETLGAMVARQPLVMPALEEFARQSLYAVGALHAVGRVHGDLNADNFLFHADTIWKLLELPFHRDAPPQDRSALFGSIYTLAPEQIEGRPPGTRSDLFALGCLFYYAASGRYPHGQGSRAEIAIGRLRFPPESLASLKPDLSPRFSAGVMQLLARHPVERPSSAEAACQLLGS